MTILVTGANGQLGSELRELSVHSNDHNFIFITRDDLQLTDEEAVNSFFEKHEVDFCINCAGYTAVDKAEEDQESAFAVNADAVANLAKACSNNRAFLVHISTDYVFPGNGNTPYRETDIVDPINIYGESKLRGEELAMEINSRTLIIRTSWVYSSYGKNFVKTMLRLMKEKEDLNVVNDQFGSPTYAADLAEAIMVIIRSPVISPGIYHYSNSGIISWFEFADKIKELTGAACKIHPVDTASYPTLAKRPAYSALDSTRIKNQFGIEIKPWEQSLRLCLKKLGN